MSRNATSFQKGHKANHSARRILTENLVLTKLREHGNAMLDILVEYAKNAEKEETRIKAADRFLTHALLHPKPNEEIADGKGTDLFMVEFVKEMQGKVSIETIDIMIEAMKKLDEKKKAQQIEEDSLVVTH